MLFTVWYYYHNLKNVKYSHGGVLILVNLLRDVKNAQGRVLLLVKLQVSAWNFTKINNPPWVFFTLFFKLYQLHQIAQSLIYSLCKRILNYIHKLTSSYERALKMRILFFLKLINKHWSVITTYFLFDRLSYLYFYGFCLDGALPFRSANELHTSNYFFILPLSWKIS